MTNKEQYSMPRCDIEELKRKFICVEKDFDYWKASCKRLEDHQRQGVLF